MTITRGGATVVSDFSVLVASGEWVALIGPNGAGKTTALRGLAGLLPFTGELLVQGQAAGPGDHRSLARQIALVAQHSPAPAELTVAEYVLLGRTPHIGYFGSESRSDRLAAERSMARLSLRQFAHRSLGSLSGGELQRVVLARALAQEAPILLLDEPTSALDLGRQQDALELIDGLRRESGLTVMSAMHDLSLAGQYADRLLMVDGGKVVALGPPDTVLDEATIARHYRANVRVLREGASTFVMPRRERHPCQL